MARLRPTTLAFVALLLAGGIASVPSAAGAQTSTTWLPSPSARAAVTDRSTVGGMQARVWSVTIGDYLASKRADINQYGWLVNAAAVERGVDAVSWTDGSTQRQRVFFERDDTINQLNYDNDVYVSWGPLPAPPSDAFFSYTDVGPTSPSPPPGSRATCRTTAAGGSSSSASTTGRRRRATAPSTCCIGRAEAAPCWAASGRPAGPSSTRGAEP